ncbi:MAG TPA: ATP-binding protein, partial [Longimicrobiales bacterium]
RLTVVAGVFAGALLAWPRITPDTSLIVTLVLLVSVAWTVGALWYTYILGREPGRGFLYAQVVFDALMVTAIVHVTGGAHSDFPPLYILVIASGALLLPMPGGALIGALASVLYVADVLLLQPQAAPHAALLQIGLFVAMALVTGALGDRLRRTGTALGVAESELHQLRLDLGEILQGIDSGIVTVDGRGRLVYLNGAGERMLGLTEREWRGLPVVEELDRRAPGLGRLITVTLSTGVPRERFEIRLPMVRGGGTMGARTTVLERKDAPWVTAVFQDITQSKRVEELKRRTERLEAVAQLGASLAHEIKNPLASIRSATEQLSGGKVTAEEDRDLLRALVLNESDRLSRLLSDFMEFSRVEVRRRERVDLAGLAMNAVGLVGQHPDARGRSIELEPPQGGVTVEGDADLLHRAVFNLVLNAVQHAGEGGMVRVVVGVVPDGQLPVGVRLSPAVRLAVADTGPGIAPADLPRLFDPFFSTRKGGTGLGLALVQRAVEAHSGAIVVEPGSAGGTGASFEVYLPSQPRGAASVAAPAEVLAPPPVLSEART